MSRQQPGSRAGAAEAGAAPMMRVPREALSSLVRLLLAAAIPVLLFGGWVAYVTSDQERARARRAALDSTARVAERIEADLAAEMRVLRSLALSLALDQGDLPRFYEEARRLKGTQPLWETVELSGVDGVQRLDLLRPLGTPLGATADRDSFDEVIRISRPVVGGVGPPGPISGKRLVFLRVPVQRDGEVRHVVSVALATNAVSSILREAGVPAGWVGAVIDRRGTIIARTQAEETEIGRPASPLVREAIARAPEGSYVGVTPEGVQVETVYRTLTETGGWSVHFGIPTDVLNAPVARSSALLAAGAAASLALAGLLAALTARDIAQRRRSEEARMALALQVSEARGSVAVEAAKLGTLRWDVGRHAVSGSERCRTLLGLPRSSPEHDDSNWSAGDVLAAVHPDDRPGLERALRSCIDRHASLDVEFRAMRKGQPRWVRVTGRTAPVGGEATSPAVIHGVVADIEPAKRAEAERLDLLRRLQEAQENEQRRIARELHDQVGQTVTGLSIGLKGLERLLQAGQLDEVGEQLRWLQSLAAEIGRDIHRAALDLRPTALDDLGLDRALGAYTAEWSRYHGIAVDFQSLGAGRRLPAEIETALYRIVQEAFTNVLKHAAARSVSVVLERRADQVRLIIEDDGAGFDLDATEGGTPGQRTRLGLSGIRERLALIGGTMTLESASGSGTTLFIQVPLNPDEGRS